MCGKANRGTVANPAKDLSLKPVEFYATLYTVLEYGQRANLTVAKFTQVKGAASSFYKVIDTLEMVLEQREVMVTDPIKKKDIEKTIKRAGL